MKRKLKWPSIGATHPVPVYEKPVQSDKEELEAFAARVKLWEERADIIAHVRLLDRDRLLEWEQARRKIIADEQRVALQSEAKLLSIETMRAYKALNREIVTEACARLEGVVIGEHELDDAGVDAKARTAMIEGADLLADVAAACLNGQYPTPTQLDS